MAVTIIGDLQKDVLERLGRANPPAAFIHYLRVKLERCYVQGYLDGQETGIRRLDAERRRAAALEATLRAREDEIKELGRRVRRASGEYAFDDRETGRFKFDDR